MLPQTLGKWSDEGVIGFVTNVIANGKGKLTDFSLSKEVLLLVLKWQWMRHVMEV